MTALADNDERARAALRNSAETGARVVVPSVVIAESTRGTASDAAVNRILNRVVIASVGEDEARAAARLKHVAGMSGVAHTIDALVVATAALAGGGAVLTSDPGDIEALAGAAPATVRAIGV